MPHTVLRGSASPSFLRSWRTWASTVRSSPYQPAPHTPSRSCWRDSARPGPFGQELQELELLGGQGDRFAVDPGLASDDVDFDPAGHEHLVGLGGAVRAAQYGLDPGHQLAGRERLGHVVVGAQFEPQDAVHLAVPGRQHQHGQGLLGPHPPAHLQSVDAPGQPHVQDHHAGPLPLYGGQPRLARAGLDDPETLAAQVQVDQVGDVGVVFDHDDGAHVGGHLSQHARLPRPTRDLRPAVANLASGAVLGRRAAAPAAGEPGLRLVRGCRLIWTRSSLPTARLPGPTAGTWAGSWPRPAGARRREVSPPR